jgi:hypothetical protein
MKKSFMAAIVASLILVSLMTGMQAVGGVRANPVYQKPSYDIVTVQFPQNTTYPLDTVSLNFTCKTNFNPSYLSYCYTLDGNGTILFGKVWSAMLKCEQRIVSETVISNDTPSFGSEPYPPYTDYLIEGTAALSSLSEGSHNLTIYRGPNYETAGAYYEPFCTVYFVIDTSSTPTPAQSPTPTITPTVSPAPTSTFPTLPPLNDSTPTPPPSPTQQPQSSPTSIPSDNNEGGMNNLPLILGTIVLAVSVTAVVVVLLIKCRRFT